MSGPDEPTDVTEPDDGEDVRRLLGALPEVAPPDGFFDELIRRRHRRARMVAVVGLAAAGVVGAIVVAQATGITGDVEPPMGELAARHSVLMTEDVSAEGEPADEVGAPYQVPDHLGSLSPGMALFHPDDVVQVVYGEDGHYVSLFEQVGELQDDAMDNDLTPLHIRGVAAWQAEDGSIIVRRAEVVYVLVGDIDPDDVTEVIADLPDARPLGLARRIGDAMDDLVDAFGLN